MHTLACSWDIDFWSTDLERPLKNSIMAAIAVLYDFLSKYLSKPYLLSHYAINILLFSSSEMPELLLSRKFPKSLQKFISPFDCRI